MHTTNMFSGFLLLGLLWFVAPGGNAATALVKIREIDGTNYVFDPTNITINPGDTVTWTNTVSRAHDSTHTPSNAPPLWRSPLLSSAGPNSSFSLNFANSGVYPYHCETHFIRGHTEETGNVTVATPNLPPTVAIISPTNGTPYFAPANFAIQATAFDMDGSVARVQFFNGLNLLGMGTNNSSSNNVSALGAGSYNLTAVATDNQGAKTTSSVVNVRVTEPPTIRLGFAQRLADGTFQFRITGGSAGQPCVIDACDTPPNWSSIFTTNFPDTKCLSCPFIEFTDNVTNLKRRFYRSRVFP